MALLIDTDLLIDLERQVRDGEAIGFPPDERLAISVITVSELIQGVLRSDARRRPAREAFVERMLDRFEPIAITAPIARSHARIWADLSASGQMIGAHDLWIAASAIGLGFGVATRNTGDFGRVEGLRIVEPTAR